MNPDSRSSTDILGRMAAVLTVLSCVAVLLLLLIRVLTHFPFYDEYLHVHSLWLFSNGGTPHVDFWCNFPVLGYILTLPYFRSFPESTYSLLALRFLMTCLIIVQGMLFAIHGQQAARRWIAGVVPLVLICCAPPVGRFLSEYSIDHFAALAAVAALVLMFRIPTIGALAGASMLCLLSVLITPKYALPLFFALCGYLLAVSVRTGKPLAALSAVALGGGLAWLTTWLLYLAAGVSLWNNIMWAHVFMTRYYLVVFNKLAPVNLAVSVLELLQHNRLLMFCSIAGVAGWVKHVRSTPWTESAGGNGLLIGCILLVTVLRTDFTQYIVPVLLCLGFFVPFVYDLIRPDALKLSVSFVVSAAVLATVLLSIPGASAEFKETPMNRRDVTSRGTVWGPPAVEDLYNRQQLLRLIPPGETVIAVWLYSPIYRRDLTFINSDEIESFSFHMDRDAPQRRYFETSYLLGKLEEKPPALISLFQLELNYPPGWSQVIREFIVRHKGLYRELEGYSTVVYLRSDLADRR